jgi:metallo-beta-lactamase class B
MEVVMKRALFVFVAMVLLLAPVLSGADPLLKLIPLKGSVYLVEDSFYAKENSVVYIGRDHVTLVGATMTPHTAEVLVDEIRKVTSLPITEVINTNHDPDRFGGNAYFKQIGAKIISTSLTRDLMQKEGEALIKQTQAFVHDYPSVPVVLPDTTYPGSFDLQNGAVRALYLGPSHKPDDIFVWFPNERILYGGCALKPQLGNMDGADLVEYPKTLQKLKDLHLPIEIIVAGHYSSLHNADLIDRYMEMLAQYKK